VEPGEVAAAGQVLLVVSDPNRTYMRGFLPENQIADVKLGQRAIVYLDGSQGKKVLFAKVSEIDSKASFTPENVYFPDDRVKQVFGVKLTIRNPDGIPKAGMPCDADIIPGELAER
jgi:HlyD family secretion protein